MIKKIKRLDSMPNRVVNRVISWQAPEFIQYKKDMKWYVVLITFGVALTTLFYFVDNYLAMAVIVLAVIVMIMTANQKPKKRLYKLSKDGLKVDDNFYPISEFKSFFITYVENVPNLHFEKTKKMSLPMSIFLIDVNENSVIDFIKLYLPENTKIKATTSDLFSKWFRF